MSEPVLHNADADVVAGSGDEWARFDQQAVPDAEITSRFEEYFSLFPWASLPANAEGFDAGCGSGRWARHVASRVGKVNAVDASLQALGVAQKALASLNNVNLITASVADMPLADAPQDFGYSLGVLHHMPDTQGGLDACVRKLESGYWGIYNMACGRVTGRFESAQEIVRLPGRNEIAVERVASSFCGAE